MNSTSRRPNCSGILGRVFGHRFTVNVGGYVYKTRYCGRCGFVLGQAAARPAPEPLAAAVRDFADRLTAYEDEHAPGPETPTIRAVANDLRALLEEEGFGADGRHAS